MISKSAIDEFYNRKLDDWSWLKEVPESDIQDLLKDIVPDFNFKTKPYTHQLPCFVIGVKNSNFLFYLDPGTGKTFLTLSILTYLKQQDNLQSALILSPNISTVTTWADQTKLHSDLSYIELTGTSEERWKLMENQADLFFLNYTGLQVMTTETQKNPKTKKNEWVPVPQLIKKFQDKFNVVIYDESHYLKSRQSLNYEICNELSKTCNYRYGLSGTPFGRSQPLHSKILTPTGWRYMGDIEIGNLVVGKDGNFIKVVNVFPQGLTDVYKVKFSDKSTTECSGNHLWTVLNRSQREKKIISKLQNKPYTLSLDTIKEDYLTYIHIKNKNKTGRIIKKRKYSIPVVSPIKFEYKEVPVSPYVLGVLLGDRSFVNNSITLASIDIDLIETLKILLPDQNIKLFKSYDKYQQRCWMISKKEKIFKKNPLIEGLRKLELWGKSGTAKFVPECYLFNSISVRTELLQGLLDTDGTVTCDGSISFCNTSLHLINAVDFLIKSLGGVCTIVGPYTRKNRSLHKNIYMITGQLPSNIAPFKLKRKLDKLKIDKKIFNLYRGIDSIEYVGKKKTQCISVDSEDGLYITDDFILTHNSPEDLWTQFHLIDRGETLGEYITLFRQAYFDVKVNKWGGYEYTFIKKYEKELNKRLQNKSIRYAEEECNSLPDKIYKKILVPFTAEGYEYYKHAVNGIIESKGNITEIKNAFVRLRQITSGFLKYKDDSGEEIEIVFTENPKLDALCDFIQNLPEDEKIVVFNEFIKSGDLISERFKKLKIKHSRLYGGTKDKKDVKDTFLTDKDCKVFLVNSQAGGVGIDRLQEVSRYTLFYESPVSSILRRQTEKRTHRSGQKRCTFIVDITLRNSMDEKILMYLKEGKDLFDSLLADPKSVLD